MKEVLTYYFEVDKIKHMVISTIINGNPSTGLDPNKPGDIIPAGRVIFFNRSTSGQQVIVTKNGVEPISLGGGELEVQLQAGSNGKTQVTYFQDPNDGQAPLKNLTLELQSQGNDKPQKILLEFDPKFKLENDAPSNTLATKKTIQNSFQTEIPIPLGIYTVRAIEANTQVNEKPQIISFKAPNRRAALEELARQLPLNPLKKAG